MGELWYNLAVLVLNLGTELGMSGQLHVPAALPLGIELQVLIE